MTKRYLKFVTNDNFKYVTTVTVQICFDVEIIALHRGLLDIITI